MSTIILLDEYSSVSLRFLLPLASLVISVGFLDHSSGVIKLSLLAIGQREPAQIRFAPVTVPVTSTWHGPANPRSDHATELPVSSARIVLAVLAVISVELQLQLQELAEVGGRRRWRRRVRREATARWTRWTSIRVSVRHWRRTSAALAIRVEQFARIERL